MRVRFRGWNRVVGVAKFAGLMAVLLWLALGWVTVAHYWPLHPSWYVDQNGATVEQKRHALVSPVWLGLLLWLGPYVVAGLVWLARGTFEFSLKSKD